MAFFDSGNPPIYSTLNCNSTTALVANPSTITVITELDSTQLGTLNLNVAANPTKIVIANWLLGGDTGLTWLIAQALSTTVGSTGNAIGTVCPIRTPANQTGQYQTKHVLGVNHRLQAYLQSTVTSTVWASAWAEVLT